MNAFIFYLFLVVGIIYMAHIGLYAVGANIHDILQFKKSAKNKKSSKRSNLPLVSVIVAAYNEELSIEKSLDTIVKSNYPRLEIIVIDDGSIDSTNDIVKNYMRRHNYNSTSKFIRKMGDGTYVRIWHRSNVKRARTIRLMTKNNGGKSSALNMALQKGVKGDFVMTLDADSMLDKQAIRRAVKYFEDENVAGVAANVRVAESLTMIGLLQRFEHMIGYRSKKFYSMTSSELIVGGVASTYRRSVLKQVNYYDTDTQTEDIGLSMKIAALGNKNYQLVYAPEVVAITQGVQTFRALAKQRYRWKLGNMQNLIKYRQHFKTTNTGHSRMLTFYRVPMAYLSEVLLLLEPFMLIYVVYLSFLLHSLTLFVGSYMVITAYVLSVIWPDEHFSLKEKVQLSSYAPIMYFVFYIMDIIQIAAIVRCLANPKKLTLKIHTDGRWISPERHGF